MKLYRTSHRISVSILGGSGCVWLMLLCGSILILFACSRTTVVTHAAHDAQRIVGKWRSPPQGWRSGEWGPSQFVIELNSSGQIEATLTISSESPGGGAVLSDKGDFRITDGILTTQVISRGEPVKLEFRDDDHLVLTLPQEGDVPGEVYEFVRVLGPADERNDKGDRRKVPGKTGRE